MVSPDINVVTYSAALMGAIIEFAKRQNPDELRPAEEWAKACRESISRRGN